MLEERNEYNISANSVEFELAYAVPSRALNLLIMCFIIYVTSVFKFHPDT